MGIGRRSGEECGVVYMREEEGLREAGVDHGMHGLN